MLPVMRPFALWALAPGREGYHTLFYCTLFSTIDSCYDIALSTVIGRGMEGGNGFSPKTCFGKPKTFIFSCRRIGCGSELFRDIHQQSPLFLCMSRLYMLRVANTRIHHRIEDIRYQVEGNHKDCPQQQLCQWHRVV